MNNKLNDRIYPEQFLLLAFISIMTFKVVMLAQYLVSEAGNEAYIAMTVMISIEIMMCALVYGIISYGSLPRLDLPKGIRYVLALLLFVTSMAKCALLASEGVSYVSTTIYDNVRWSYVCLALMLVCCYLAYKGGKVIARTAQILFWLMALSFAFHVVFAKTDLQFVNLLPLEFSADIAVACDKYLVWFGDYSCLLFLSVSKSPNAKGKRLAVWTALAIIGTFVCAVGLMVIFVCVFGDSGAIVGNAFLNVSSLNKIAFMIGSMDLPTVCSWVVMCTIRLSLLLYAGKECLKIFFGEKWWLSAVCALTAYLLIVYGIGNLKTGYSIATSALRYFVYFTDFIAVIALYIFVHVKYKKANKPKALPSPQNPALKQISPPSQGEE